MFNLSGSEVIFLVLIALVVLGPDKLPEAMRKAGKAYADFKKMTTGFQSEMKSVLEEPMRELRETAELAKRSAMWDINEPTKPVTARMQDHTPPSDEAARHAERALAPDLDVSTAALPEPEPKPEPSTDEILANVEVTDAAVASGTIMPGAVLVDPSSAADAPVDKVITKSDGGEPPA